MLLTIEDILTVKAPHSFIYLMKQKLGKTIGADYFGLSPWHCNLAIWCSDWSSGGVGTPQHC